MHSFNTVIKVADKRIEDLKTKHLRGGSYNQQMPFIKLMEERAPQTHYLSKLTNPHCTFKTENYGKQGGMVALVEGS